MATTMASTLARAASSSLASRTPSFSNRLPSPRATTPLASPRPGSATPTHGAAAAAAQPESVVAAAASVLLSNFRSSSSRVVTHATATLEAEVAAADVILQLPHLPVKAVPVLPGMLGTPLPDPTTEPPAAAAAAAELAAATPLLLPPVPSPSLGYRQQAQHALQDQQQQQQDGSIEAELELGELLGRGTFGDVYCATQRASGMQVAVKVVPKFKNGRDRRQAIYQEVNFCRSMQSCPAVVRLHGVYEDATNIYIVQELCSGGDVASLLMVSGGRLDEKEAASIMLTVLRFLAHTHRDGVCYGDVKPNNFVLRNLYPSVAHMLDAAVPKGPISLCAVDFGCCQHTEPDACLPGVPVSGTPAYLAPEAFRQCFGMPSDVWAAGVMLYHLLSGSFPFWSGGPEEFHGMSAAELRDGIVRGTPVFLKNPWTSYSPKVKDLICKMLEKDPRQRITARAACAHPWFGEVLGGEAAAGVEGAGAAAQLST